ncbi:MAG: hypothetical protein JO146_08375 [Candidatus Eremiobacteraeota bacterium]|nr:hypothetical protein [Candidatus Eremiobacteraeota bacterium]
MPNEVNSNRELPSHNKKFEYTGTAQSFSVPAGVTTITVNAIGAAGLGAFGSPCQPDCFGRGGRVYAKIPVKPGEKLYVYVGGRGTPTAGGFNGGGNPGNTYTWPGNGGGGASDVREGGDALKDRVLVAAGGGGQGGLASNPYPYYQCYGGNGGGKDGAHGGSVFGGGGAGGSQTQGGAGGAEGSGYGSGSPGQPGSGGALGRGGNGGTGAKASGSGNDGGAGGGGGGGYYGGGGGAGGASSIKGYYGAGPGGGGGGGSSWAERSAMHFRTWAGWKNATGNGSVVLTW